jgi:hypothetical protein
MVSQLRFPATDAPALWGRVAGRTAIVMLLCLGAASSLSAQDRGVHYLHQGVMPPGAIGSLQLQRGGPLRGFFQPVEIKAPHGALVSLAVDGTFDEPQRAPARVGMLIGQVYRIRVMNIPLAEGMEVFPTVEVIDRLYTPHGQESRFAIPVELTSEDLQMALEGKFVTRVIYLEDPRRALPVQDDPRAQNWFEAGARQDPLAVADRFGRPVAILRMGARVPDLREGFDARFLYGCPPLVKYPPRVKVLPRPPKKNGPETSPPLADPGSGSPT